MKWNQKHKQTMKALNIQNTNHTKDNTKSDNLV
jgi:ribosomal protein L30/L7E